MKDNIGYIVVLIIAAGLIINGTYHVIQYYEGKARIEARAEAELRCNAKIQRILKKVTKHYKDEGCKIIYSRVLSEVEHTECYRKLMEEYGKGAKQ